MTDIENKELLINDKVIYATKEGNLSKGFITNFYKSYYGDDECSVKNECNTHSHISKYRICKIGGME